MWGTKKGLIKLWHAIMVVNVTKWCLVEERDWSTKSPISHDNNVVKFILLPMHFYCHLHIYFNQVKQHILALINDVLNHLLRCINHLNYYFSHSISFSRALFFIKIFFIWIMKSKSYSRDIWIPKSKT